MLDDSFQSSPLFQYIYFIYSYKETVYSPIGSKTLELVDTINVPRTSFFFRNVQFQEDERIQWQLQDAKPLRPHDISLLQHCTSWNNLSKTHRSSLPTRPTPQTDLSRMKPVFLICCQAHLSLSWRDMSTLTYVKVTCRISYEWGCKLYKPMSLHKSSWGSTGENNQSNLNP